jgi:hypothetical protein
MAASLDVISLPIDGTLLFGVDIIGEGVATITFRYDPNFGGGRFIVQTINFVFAERSEVPKSECECRDGGYKKFGPPAGPFKNQGQCIKYVNDH